MSTNEKKNGDVSKNKNKKAFLDMSTLHSPKKEMKTNIHGIE